MVTKTQKKGLKEEGKRITAEFDGVKCPACGKHLRVTILKESREYIKPILEPSISPGMLVDFINENMQQRTCKITVVHRDGSLTLRELHKAKLYRKVAPTKIVRVHQRKDMTDIGAVKEEPATAEKKQAPAKPAAKKKAPKTKNASKTTWRF